MTRDEMLMNVIHKYGFEHEKTLWFGRAYDYVLISDEELFERWYKKIMK